MKNEKEFMLLFRYTPNPGKEMTPEEMEQQHQAWSSFIGQVIAQEKLVSTHQLGFNGIQLNADHSTEKAMHTAEGKIVGGNMIVKARNIDEALTIAGKSPILKAGGTVEVRDIIPMN